VARALRFVAANLIDKRSASSRRLNVSMASPRGDVGGERVVDDA
jgi:hypothetical protein